MGLTCRLVTSLTVLLVTLGLPVAPVICDLMCPQATVATAEAPRVVRLSSPVGRAPCHEVAAPDVERADQSGGLRPDSAERERVASRPMHGCDHPTVVASRASFEGFRLLAPVVTVDAAMHLGPRQAPHARVVPLASSRPPSPNASGAFSPILRI